MNYLQNYLEFYSGTNRKEIFSNFYQFIEGLRSGDFDKYNQLMTDDCLADISMTGHAQGIREIKKALTWPGPQMDSVKITIWNFVARSHNNCAQQSAYVQCIYSIHDEETVYPFVFGGHFVNSYKKIENTWKMTHIRFDLMYEHGNNSYVKDHWTLIDYGIFYGHKPMINAEFDSPWHVIPEDDEPQSDAEQIFETEFKLNFGMDGGNFELTKETFTDDVAFIMSAHKNVNKYNPTQTDGDYHGPVACNNFLKSKHHKEPRMQHTDSMADLAINGDEAVAYMFRSEFNRTANRIYSKQTLHTSVYTVLHKNRFRKINGKWKLCEFTYIPVLDFIDIDDDCLCYDDFICGGTKWSEIEK